MNTFGQSIIAGGGFPKDHKRQIKIKAVISFILSIILAYVAGEFIEVIGLYGFIAPIIFFLISVILLFKEPSQEVTISRDSDANPRNLYSRNGKNEPEIHETEQDAAANP